MLRKVIFVCGTPFSGSTMLDMILANDAAGFSCGQVRNMFYPFRRHQVNPPCDCGDRNCSVWSKVYTAGPRNLYKSISDMFPDATFIVDSSKDPCWVARQGRVARTQGLEVLNVLTWKSPEGLKRSFSKRGLSAKFVSTYLGYHRTFNSLIPHWIGVQHERLIEEPDVLGQLCERLGIPMFDGKHNFWEKRHHTLFGNNSAKVSLYSQDHQRFDTIRKKRVRIDGEKSAPIIEHRSIYHAQAATSTSDDGIDEGVRSDLERLAAQLRARSIAAPLAGSTGPERFELPRASRIETVLRCAFKAIRRDLAKQRYRQRFD